MGDEDYVFGGAEEKEKVTLGEQQRLFAKLVGQLLQYIYEHGYECTLDWAYRPPEIAAQYQVSGKGIANSLHCKRLAIDLNLFKDGQWLSKSNDHTPIGEWWESLHPLARWGGRWQDGNHYSLEYERVK